MRTCKGMLRGEKLTARLAVLKEAANEHHEMAVLSWQGGLEHKRLAGLALQEAYERLGRRSKWSRWRNANFDGAPRTARLYCQIARHWDDPRIAAVRKRGLDIDSIGAFMRALQGKKEHSRLAESKADLYRRLIRKMVAEKLRTLKDYELEVLEANFRDRLWEQLYAELKRTVCGALEHDYYGEYDEDQQADFWREVKKRRRT